MSDGPERRIVVGVEGSGYARAALIWALEEAHHRGAVIEVVTCYSPAYVPAAPDLGYVPLDSFDLAAEVEKMLYTKALDVLVSELAFALNTPEEKAMAKVEGALS